MQGVSRPSQPVSIVQKSLWPALQGKYGRGRRELRRRLLEPILVGWPMLRDIVMNALAARGHLILCESGDARFFVDPGDRAVGAALIWHGAHQRSEFDRAIAILSAAGRLRSDGVFVDVGANIGTHTVYALRGGRFARAIAFEPEPGNARLLSMNLDVNGVAQRAAVMAKAAGAAPGRAVLHLHPRNKGAHAIGFAPAVDGVDRLEVPVVRVDDQLRELGVAAGDVGLVWMDVEGYEPQAMDGLGEILERAVPIAFEFSPHRYDAATKRQLVQRLAAHYAHMHRLSDPAAQRLPIAALASIAGIDDVLVY
jgi:FkbM family methyltransferase